MRARARAHEVPIDPIDLETLDHFLASEHAPPDSMPLSDLDGFLTGIAVGPELVMPSEWLPLIFGGDAPAFANQDEAKTILGAIRGRYNEILRQVGDNTCDPIFWADQNGTLIAADWAEGFLQAIMLRMDAWGPLFKSKRDSQLLYPIMVLCGDENGESLLGIPREEEDRMMEVAAEFIPDSVIAIATYWRKKGPKQTSIPLMVGTPNQPDHTSAKVNRNDPCRCGSGKKFKKCCGKAA